ncbi:MAG: hypothetical protein U1E25_14255 [Methylocystis sp.]
MLRRVFLHGASRCRISPGTIATTFQSVPRDWSKKVERLVLDGTWDKGGASPTEILVGGGRFEPAPDSGRAPSGSLANSGPQKADADKGFIRKFIDKASNIGRTMFDMRASSTRSLCKRAHEVDGLPPLVRQEVDRAIQQSKPYRGANSSVRPTGRTTRLSSK